MAEGKAPDFDCVTGEELKASGNAILTFYINCAIKSGKRKPSLTIGAGIGVERSSLPSSKRRINWTATITGA